MQRLMMIFLMILGLLVPFHLNAGEKIGGGDLTFRPNNAPLVVFSHEKHVSGGGLKCTGCHYSIFQMQHGSYKLDMSKIRKGDFCGKCHNGQKAFDVKEVKNCSRCHK